MINSAYAYYLSTYAGKQLTKYDTHKKSELKQVYNEMIRVNQKSPLFKIFDVDSVSKNAIDIKETAREFKNVASSLTSIDGGIAGFLKKKVVTNDEKSIDVKYVGAREKADDAEEIDLQIESLATKQVNIGDYMSPSGKMLKPGDYYFDVEVGDYTYEFSFNVSETEKNEQVQDKLIRLFNRAEVGLNATKKEDIGGNTAICIESQATGVPYGKKQIFTISENEKSKADVVKRFGLDKVLEYPANAHFKVNGESCNSESNTFVANGLYQITLKEANEENNIKVGMRQDFESVLENVGELISSYNNMIDIASEKSGVKSSLHSRSLQEEIVGMANFYRNELESAGFKIDEEGYMSIDEGIIVQAAEENNLEESLEVLNIFKKALVRKADEISVDPMRYVDKKMISYPNPLSHIRNPYITSMYSGMIFNGYI